MTNIILEVNKLVRLYAQGIKAIGTLPDGFCDITQRMKNYVVQTKTKTKV